MEEDIKILEEFIKYFEAEATSIKYRRNISITVGEDDIQAIENLINRVKDLEEDIKNMYDEEVVISIISDEFDLSRNEVLELLEG